MEVKSLVTLIGQVCPRGSTGTAAFRATKAALLCAKVQPIRKNACQVGREQEHYSKISCAFLYTSNEQPENEGTATIPFTIAQKGITYLGINLTNENYNTLLGETKDLK